LTYPKPIAFQITGELNDPPPVKDNIEGKSNVGADEGTEDGSPDGILLGCPDGSALG
jgi:hypothetical protein